MKILIVDDSRMIRQAIRAVLEALSFEADEAADGQEALQKVTAFPEGYDLILLDWNMPVMDGHDTLRTLQADPNLHRIPVVMVTTECEIQNVTHALQHGARGYIAKPFTPEDLGARILQILDQVKAEET